MDALIGKRLGQYEILSKLGSGGMAHVYRARQTSVDRDVAVKVIRTDLTEDPAFMERFAREARTIASLSHLHILKVFDYGQQDGIAYLVMELLEGGSLSALILKQGALSLSAAVRILAQIAGALDYAHEKGIVHRDLKSDNVLLDTAENAYLTDFGIARLLNDSSRMTQTGTVMGTPAYMAPELWTGRPADKQADIYALGVILYEMITGSTPFTGDTPYVIMYQHLNEIPPVDATSVAIPDAVQTVILQAMAKKPEDRYPTAMTLMRAYDEAIGGVSDTRRAVTPSVKTSDVASSDGPPTQRLPSPKDPTEASKPTVVEKIGTSQEATVAHKPASNTKWGWTAGAVLAIMILLVVLVVSQTQQQQANIASTALALAGTQTESSKPTITPTITQSPTPTTTPVPVESVTPTDEALDDLRFDTYTNKELNIAFRYPAGWDVQLVEGTSLFVTKDFKKLDFSNPAQGITGAPYIQVIIGDAETLGVLQLKAAKTPEEAMLAFLGLDRVTNLDRVEGTRFPTATTRRVRQELGVVRHLYTMILGEDHFVMALLQAGPHIEERYNNNAMLPLIRSIDTYVQVTSTPIPSMTPAPTVFFPTPSAFDTQVIPQLGIEFAYPRGWNAIADELSASFLPFENTKQLSKFKLDDFNRPYQVYMRFDDKNFIRVQGDVGIETLFADNYNSYTVDPVQLYDAPFPTVYARAGEKTVLGIAVRGWVALIKVREDLYISVFAHAGAGREDAFLNGVVLPLLKSFKDTRATASASPTP